MKLFLSRTTTFGLQDEIRCRLSKSFLKKPFREKENYLQFAHEVDLDYNDMYKYH
jgi:hypothetical protein